MVNNKENIDIPDKLPLLPIRDIVIFPYMVLPLFVGRENSLVALDEALSGDRLLFLTAQNDPNAEDPVPNGVYKTGCISIIIRMHKLPDGRAKILVQGLHRAKIKDFINEKGTTFVKIDKMPEAEPGHVTLEVEALIRHAKDLLDRLLTQGKVLPPDIMTIIDEISEPGKISDLIVSNLRLKVEESQEILETADPLQKLRRVCDFLAKELELLEVQSKIKTQARDEISKTQKEYFLREQMKAIKSELGDVDSKTEEVADLRNKIQDTPMPDNVRSEALKQLKRLDAMHPDSAESSLIRTYLDWILALPWEKGTEDNLNIKTAKKILDEDHYDLDKVKDRILDYLSVCKIKQEIKGPILCFVGPPGVGKTSLGKSIARSMGRKFIRMSLGGIKDEAEIRGHRRTYVGALPGRIIQGLKQCGSNNPVFMLDEIDKLGADFRGDPSSALLEVLDPEQNFSFNDNYLNLTFDLSKVMFISTANLVDPIPQALKDRMEVMNLSGYSEEEKIKIARQFLIPKQLQENGIKVSEVKLSDQILTYIIRFYTREAGLRNIERAIGTVFRKIARKLAEGKKYSKDIGIEMLRKFLGPEKYSFENELKENLVGVVTGLAWTQYGGEILHVESSLMSGKSHLTLTGQLGDVMKESAMAALSFIKSNAETFNVDEKRFEKLDIHVHVPSGAIPKDGPSAGVTMVASMLSAITGKAIRKDIAMTGEITLRGRVLPVGGIKEKVLAAARSGLKTIIIPDENKKDLIELSEDIKKKINFIFANTIYDVLEQAFVKKSKISTKSIKRKTKLRFFEKQTTV